MVQALVDVLVEGGDRHPGAAGARAAGRCRGGRRRRTLGRSGAVGPARAPHPVGRGPAATGPGRRQLGRGGRAAGRRSGSPSDPGEPVVGWGHRSAFMGRDGTTAELDAVSTEVPILLISGDGHHGWGNTLALSMLGLPVRDDVVRENEWFDAYPRVPVIAGRTDTPAAYRDALAAAAALGVVGLVDFEFNAPREPWVERWHDGCDLLRVRWATYAAGLDEVVEAGLRTGDALLNEHAPAPTTDSPWGRSRSSATGRSTPGRRGAATRTPTPMSSSTRPVCPTSRATSCVRCSAGPAPPGSRSRRTRSATRPWPTPCRPTPTPARPGRSSTPSWSVVTTYAGWPSSACGPASSRRTSSTTATSPRRSGRAAASGASPSAG